MQVNQGLAVRILPGNSETPREHGVHPDQELSMGHTLAGAGPIFPEAFGAACTIPVILSNLKKVAMLGTSYG
jgi:hypothetical protein